MGYNYKMHDKTPQQKAIVSQREREEAIRKKEREKQNQINCRTLERNGQYDAVLFSKGNESVLELRVSYTAIANQPCGLVDTNIHEWLQSVGMKYAKEHQVFETVLIVAKDVRDGELVTDWKNLERIDN